MILVKYEIWPVLLRQLGKRGIPVYLTSAIFARTQLFFKWYGKWYLSNLKLFAGIFVQNDSSRVLLEKKGIKGVEVCGDTRIDRVLELANHRVQSESCVQR